MRDIVWGGKTQKLVQDDGTRNGAELILHERGINTSRLKLEQMQIILANHYDFKDEVSSLEIMLTSKGHTAMFLPKFHCELIGIERVWGHSKRIARVYCDYTFALLRQNMPYSFDSISAETIKHYIERSRNYMFAYLGGNKPGESSASCS